MKFLVNTLSMVFTLVGYLWLKHIARLGYGFLSYAEIGSRNLSASRYNGSFTLPDSDTDSDSWPMQK